MQESRVVLSQLTWAEVWSQAGEGMGLLARSRGPILEDHPAAHAQGMEIRHPCEWHTLPSWDSGSWLSSW